MCFVWLSEQTEDIFLAKPAFGMNFLSTSNLDLNLRKKVLKFYIWGRAFYNTEIWILRKVHHKYLESSEMWSSKKVEKIIWTEMRKCRTETRRRKISYMEQKSGILNSCSHHA
jgi:hypothetical protein